MSEEEVFAPEGGELSARERLYAQAGQAREGRRSLAAVLLALAAFGMVLSVSAWQVTGEGTALPLLRSALASLTDIDQFVAEHEEALRTEAARSEGPIDAPGYPLPVVLDAAEVREADDAALRTMLLDRSAALVYAEGLEAFDRTGEQAIDRLSVEGLLELAAGQLSSGTHARAGAAAVVLAVAVAVFGAMLGALSEGWSRMRAPAAAIGLGGVAAAGLSFAAWVVAGQIGGGDAFMADLRQVVQAGLSAGTRNGAIVAGAGLAAAAAAWALEALERRAAREPGAAVEEAPLEQEGREAS